MQECAPCILFFDEVDALTTKRGKEGGWVVERLLNQLLIELDGADERKGVYVIGATNRPEVMDPAIHRPGRLGKKLYVPLPSPDERGLILKALARKKPIDASVDLMKIVRDNACNNLSGADLSALMNEAAMLALEDKLKASDTSDEKSWTIEELHFERAVEKISPSVSDKTILPTFIRNLMNGMKLKHKIKGVYLYVQLPVHWEKLCARHIYCSVWILVRVITLFDLV